MFKLDTTIQHIERKPKPLTVKTFKERCAMEQPNELMTWKEMKKRYPDKWVIVDKTEGNASTVKAGIVKYVASDDEIEDIWIECHKQGFDYYKRRTTVDSFMGIVDGINFSIDAEAVYK